MMGLRRIRSAKKCSEVIDPLKNLLVADLSVQNEVGNPTFTAIAFGSALV
uniref:Uncharacterized protein n=1 Tax=Sinorhizobium fredii (strain NBRC 101917 / NGR234) TaxID=394 RepID=Q6W129_SINFN|nr:Hypothetical protein RNGR00414 [Sinorhizobium fredii NGR234]